MKQILVKSGEVVVDDIPRPQVGRKNILVRVNHSCISPGTEMSSVKSSGELLYKRLLKKPEYIRKVIRMVSEKGIAQTKSLLQSKISAAYPIGYSASGVIVEIGDEVTGFAIGDKVACAGAGIANHAEFIDVPVNLAVKLSEFIDTSVASTVTLGAIAMQGIRRTNPTLGEKVVVVGLGILGQLTAQLLKLNGCHTIGIDVDPERIKLAVENGMEHGIDPSVENIVDRVHKLTAGFGADAVIITAASTSNTIVSEAMQMCRRKGRVVLVGAVGLDLKRDDFYKKELDFFISTSYGPGRYDAVYEEEGQDYPLPYVRWTENRNMEEYLLLLSQKKIDLSKFINTSYSIDTAVAAYNDLKKEGSKPLLIILNYPDNTRKEDNISKIFLKTIPVSSVSKISIGMVGAGGFAQSTHLPNLSRLQQYFDIRAIMSRTGTNAMAIAKQFHAVYATTDYAEVIRDPDIDLVFISTRHDLHTKLALQALKAGKNVFVEKPLALTQEELSEVISFFENNESAPVLMTGFNRRFSKMMVAAKDSLYNRTTPVIVNYRMNAGYISNDVWVQGKEGGGRNLGEACHIYDLFNYLIGSEVVSVKATSIIPKGKQWNRNDNFIATISYADGSLCTLTYTSMGEKSYPKERMDIFFDGKIISMDDFKTLNICGGKSSRTQTGTGQKGQLEELISLGECLVNGKAWPISLRDQVSATEISFEVERQIQQQ